MVLFLRVREVFEGFKRFESSSKYNLLELDTLHYILYCNLYTDPTRTRQINFFNPTRSEIRVMIGVLSGSDWRPLLVVYVDKDRSFQNS